MNKDARRRHGLIPRLRHALLAMMMLAAGGAQAQSVIMSGNYYLTHNEAGTAVNTAATTTFNPATCLWAFEQDNYIRTADSNGDAITTTNNYLQYTSVTLGGDGFNWYNATAGSEVYHRTGGMFSRTYYYLRLNGTTWQINQTNSNNGILYAVTISDVAPNIGTLTIDAPANVLNHTGTYTFGHNTPTYRAGYTNYYFNNANHYVDANGNSITPANATVGSYTWSISDNAYATMSTGGVVTVASLPEADMTVTVTLTANVTGGTPAVPAGTTLTATQEVTILGSLPVKPDIAVSGTTVTITTDAAGTPTIHYTLDGSEPTASSPTYSGAIDLSGATDSPVTIKAVTVRDGNVSDVTTQTVTLTIPAPTITTDGAAGTASISSSLAGATIYYTTDGTTPTTSSTEYTGTITGLATMTTVKAIAVKSGWNNSPVASDQLTIPSGVSGGTVTLFDYEDHNWTYYKGVDSGVDGGTYNTNYDGKLYSPNPRNVKITYKANGGAVSIDESETEFVYYKTLEEGTTSGQYPYTVISNPFSKRPDGKGFGGWRIKEGANYINGYNDEAVLPLDAEIVFTNLPYTSVNCTSAEIELEATWVNLNNITYANGNNITYNVSGGNYETNILVLSRNVTGTITTTSPVTIMMVEPDGSRDYRGTYAFTGNITPNNNGVSKIEFTRWNSTNTLNCNNHSVTVGRGMTTTSQCASYVTGVTGATTNRNLTTYTANLNYHLKIESGTFTDVSFIAGTEGTAGYVNCNGTSNQIKGTLGNDYDRAKEDNTKLTVADELFLGYRPTYAAGNQNSANFKCWVKSGNLCSGTNVTNTTFNNQGEPNGGYYGDASQLFYCSVGGAQTNIGKRHLYVEGGILSGIAGGIDSYNPADEESFFVRMTGGQVRGVVYGSGAFAASSGVRRFVITGGTINGWVAAGCNGTDPTQSGGTLPSDTYIYVGGDAHVGNATDLTLNTSSDGNIFGAGSGNAAQATTGQVNNSNIVIADECTIKKNVFGGGNYGYSNAKATVYVTGGTVSGSVYGGSNQKQGNTVEVDMAGGLVKGNVFGGSNVSGVISGKATLNIMGGTVGTTTVEDWTTMAGGRIVKTDIIASDGCVFGGGYGENTNMAQGVEINIGQADDEKPTVIYNNVYGGGKLGNVSANATATNDSVYITMTGGTIHGKLFGGGSGAESDETAALVEGNATIHVSGGQIDKAVYGGGELASVGIASDNNTGLINILIDGTASLGTDDNCKYVYGGGYVYGSGYGKPGLSEFTYVKYTTVTIGGDAHVRGSVFGSGENGHVRKDTKVYIKENCFIGTELTEAEHVVDANGRGVLIYRGNVYGGGRGMDVYSSGGLETYSLTAGRVDGNTFVEVSGGTIYHDVFGGGSLATVGVATIDPSTGLPDYNDENTGNTEVHIKGGVIGYSSNEDAQGFNCGFVYGGCRGLAAEPSSQAVQMAYVHDAKVYIEPGANIKGSVFGGGANGHVKDDTYVEISGGSIGTKLLADEVGFDDHGVAVKPVFRGNVYAGGRGVDLYQKAGTDMYSLTAGAVYGNAELKMTAGHVWHNVYGSGSMASVGTVKEKPAGAHVHDEIVNAGGTVVNPDGSEVNYLTGVFEENTGKVTVTIIGGTVGDTTPGHEGRNNGRVYGAGRGVSADRSDLVASMEYVNETYVNIGTAGQTSYTAGDDAPYIYGAVFGGGENGHVKTDTHVNIHSGIIGWPLDAGPGNQYMTAADGTSNNPRRGHVYGGGRGVDPTYHGASEARSSTAGRVYGHAYVNMTGGVVRRAIYGGGNLASVGIYRLLDSDLHIIDMIEDEEDSGDAYITITGGIIGNVNPDGSALTGTASNGYAYLAPGDNNGHVFGSSCGMVADTYTVSGVAVDTQYRQMGYSHSTHVNISGGHMYGSIFGSGENGHVWEDTHINISGGEIGSESSTLIYSGNVYGSGRGVDHPHGDISETAGKVRGNTIVNMTGGTVWRDVYGGGSLASVGDGEETAADSKKNVTTDPLTNNPFPYSTGLTRVVIDNASVVHGSVYGSGRGVASAATEYKQAAYVKNTLVTIKGGAHVHKNVFGGGNAGHVRRNTLVDILDNAKVDGNVYGGGAGAIISPTAGLVNHDVEVNIKGGVIGKDVYGGGAIANTNVHDKRNNPSLYADGSRAKANASTYGKPSEDATCKTVVNLLGGFVLGDAYGGGQGVIPASTATAAEKANAGALVRGDVTVTLNGTAFYPTTKPDDKGNNIAASGRVFGCNNLNGSPQGTVLVHVLKTVGTTKSGDTYSVNTTKPTKNTDTYEVEAVYGGGNLAAYDPWDAEADGQYTAYTRSGNPVAHSNTDKPVQVVVDACDLASICYVYGGGNAAPAPATDVLIVGSYEIGSVFGGGNGKDRITTDGSNWAANPGANVGIIDTTAYKADPTTGIYGTGKSLASVVGGTVHNTFGGSNTLGNVRTEAQVYLDEASDCPLSIGEVYGGGNEAYMEGDSKITLGCISTLDVLYGGARNANVDGDIDMTVTSGHFGRIFGGNNLGGTISGSIRLNIEETGCNPITIGELYGCGNNAPYQTPAGKPDPTLNLKSFTSIGRVFGGGLGTGAVVKGNPTVNINLVVGENATVASTYPGTTINYTDGSSVTLPTHDSGKIGAIGTVFGGGNAAEVQGNTNVHVGTENTISYESGSDHTAKTVVGADIRSNIFGGGNAAKVTGNTNVEIGQKL